MNVAAFGEGEAGPRYRHQPGKGSRPKSTSPILYAILLSIHGVFHSYSVLRAGVSRLYGTFTSFVLTSSSRELIKSDISTLSKIPSHLAVIIHEDDLEKLVNDVADLAAWSICSSISMLTIYEVHGKLKGMDASLQVSIKRKIRRYFREMKKITINTPAWGATSNNFADEASGIPDLEVNILSMEDGREAVLDLTRSLCKLVSPDQRSTKRPVQNGHVNGHEGNAIRHRVSSEHLRAAMTLQGDRSDSPRPMSIDEGEKMLKSEDITIPFLDAHLSSSTIPEPNLLLIFSTDRILSGFPPWSMRLCEICYVGRSGRVSYRGFLKGLQQFGRAEMRFGH